MTTQNSGVVVIENIGQGHENIDYYRILINVLELQYPRGKQVVLFHCKWFAVLTKREVLQWINTVLLVSIANNN